MYLADSMARGKENKEEVQRMRRLALEIPTAAQLPLVPGANEWANRRAMQRAT